MAFEYSGSRELGGRSIHEQAINTMQHKNSLMHDLLKQMPCGGFDGIVASHDAGRGMRRLAAKSQFAALIACLLPRIKR